MSKVNLPSRSDRENAFLYLDFGPYYPEALSMYLFVYSLNSSPRKQRLPLSFLLLFLLPNPQSTGMVLEDSGFSIHICWISKKVNDSLSQNIQQDPQI